MPTGSLAPARHAVHDASDHEALRTETLNLMAVAVVILLYAVLALVALVPEARRPAVLLVVAALLAAVAASRLQRLNLTAAAILLIAGLSLAIVSAALVFPGSQLTYCLTLVVIAASVLLGGLPAFGVAALASATVLVLAQRADDVTSGSATGTVLSLIWSTAALSWLASRPTRTALEWAWRNYLLALQRTEELRDRQGELGRLAKSLNEACVQLEQMNAELERARRAAEEARRLKAEFAATISHELRTPLNLIVGFSEMMMMDGLRDGGRPALPETYRPGLEAIHRNANHISRLIDDVLDLSQIEAHRMALEKRWVSVGQIVEEAVETVASLFEHLGLGLAVEIPVDLPPLYVDPNRVRQILINLLNNAVRFTERGGVTIRATCDDREVVLAVTDTGDGIASEDLPYLFQEFHQAGPPDRRRDGSGLGLAVCKRFAEMHGGYLRVESCLGQGSTFHLALPLCEHVVSAPMALPPSPRPSQARTIAVLDRAPEAAKVFQRYLDGYQVVWAEDLGTLRRLAVARPLHALIVAGSGKSGEQCELPAADPCLRNLPVLTCSLRTSRSIAEELGVAEYLVKPVSRERLTAALRRWGKGARDALVVEDDPEMGQLLAGLVRASSRRCRVRRAGDGAEALEELRQKRPDVVLLDLLMPRVSGYEVLRQMKADAALRDVPVLVISAKGAREETVRTSALSLTRPDGLTVGELMGCLQSSLDVLLNVVPPDTAPVQSAGSAE